MPDMLLMRFWSKKCFEKPSTVCDLVYLPYLFKGSDCLTHDGNFFWSIVYLLDGDWRRVPGVDHAFVLFDGDEDSLLVKYRPVFLNKVVDTVSDVRVKVG
jgi:hypothetical protein